MRLNEAVDLFLQERRGRGCGVGTLNTYRQHCMLFVSWLESVGVVDSAELDGIHIAKYLDSLRERDQLQRKGKLSPITIHKRMKHIRTFLLGLSRRGVLDREVVYSFAMPKTRRRLPKSLSPEQVNTLLSAQMDIRDRAILYLMLDAGLRISETVALTREDLDFARGMVHIRHGKGDKERYSLFASATADCLHAWLDVRQSPTPFLFVDKAGQHLTNSGVYKIVVRVARSVGLKVNPHALRHTFATEFLDAGGQMTDLQLLMGHEDIKTTMVYVNVAFGRIRERFANGLSLVNRIEENKKSVKL